MALNVYGLWGPGHGPFTPSTPLLDGPAEDESAVLLVNCKHAFVSSSVLSYIERESIF